MGGVPAPINLRGPLSDFRASTVSIWFMLLSLVVLPLTVWYLKLRFL